MKNITCILILVFTFANTIAQTFSIDKIEPPNWWTGMKHNKIQLMIYGKDIANVKVNSKSSDIKIQKLHSVENPNYLFVDIAINKNAKAGEHKLIFSKNGKTLDYNYLILSRNTNKNQHQGFGTEDVIYLLMPDRFANGDTSNDFIDGYFDSLQTIPTQARKGGDIAGLINKLDYIKDFGATVIWLTPLLENNTFRSYHGYSTTNHYKIDPRLGDLNDYKNLVSIAHDKGLKIIMDHVANHIAIDHPWIKNLPMQSWINGSVKNHLSANHNKMSFFDIHADSVTIKEVQEGWFTSYMPDLNHENKYLSKYLIQNTLWWIESTGIDGIREDTYPYCNQKFMSNWAKEILIEYPNLKILGEVWTGESDYLACYQADSKLNKGYNSHLFSVTDFALRDALVKFLQGNKNMYEIFNTISKDYLYTDANNLVTFIDNHDVGRAMFYADSNVAKFKLAFHLLLTTRGIPQIFYGTEIGMKENEDHGTLRKKFPGGFPDDIRNAFKSSGRTAYENDIFNYLKKLIHIRKNHKSLTLGRLIHFPPKNDVYVFFREFGNELTMSIINASDHPFIVDKEYYSQLNKFNNAFDLINEKELETDKIIVEPMTASLYLIN